MVLDPKVKSVALSHRLGGQYGVQAVMEQFFSKLVAAKNLKHYFEDRN